MRFGINTFLFTCPFTDQSVKQFPAYKKWGFDTVEIAIDDPAGFDPHKVRAALDRAGLACGSICGCFGPDRDLRGTPEAQRNSLDYMRRCIDHMGVLGCQTLSGPVYSAVGRIGGATPAERRRQWATVRKNLGTIARYAARRGVTVCVEPLNRFETDFINTVDQALEMLDEVDSPALGIHLDTFHMNIEEKSQPAAIRRAGKRLKHFHACGCDRGTPGNDHIDWAGIAAALKAVRYDRDVVIESFTLDVKVIAKAAAIWRQIEPSREEIATKGLRFLRKTLQAPAR